MAVTTSGQLIVTSNWLSESDDGIAVTKDQQAYVSTVTWVSANSGNGSINRIYRATRTVAAGDDDDIDLSTALSDPFGNTLAFQSIRELCIVNKSQTAGEKLLVGGAGTSNNAWSAPFNYDADAVLRAAPGSPLVLSDFYDGFRVVNGSEDVLRVHNGTAEDIDYDIIIKGLV